VSNPVPDQGAQARKGTDRGRNRRGGGRWGGRWRNRRCRISRCWISRRRHGGGRNARRRGDVGRRCHGPSSEVPAGRGPDRARHARHRASLAPSTRRTGVGAEARRPEHEQYRHNGSGRRAPSPAPRRLCRWHLGEPSTSWPRTPRGQPRWRPCRRAGPWGCDRVSKTHVLLHRGRCGPGPGRRGREGAGRRLERRRRGGREGRGRGGDRLRRRGRPRLQPGPDQGRAAVLTVGVARLGGVPIGAVSGHRPPALAAEAVACEHVMPVHAACHVSSRLPPLSTRAAYRP
jgi:hypothetical protein